MAASVNTAKDVQLDLCPQRLACSPFVFFHISYRVHLGRHYGKGQREGWQIAKTSMVQGSVGPPGSHVTLDEPLGLFGPCSPHQDMEELEWSFDLSNEMLQKYY